MSESAPRRVRLLKSLSLGETRSGKQRFVGRGASLEVLTEHIPEYSAEDRETGLGLREGQVWAWTVYGFVKLEADEWESI